jgi:biotin carboxyl carrier protein
MKYRLEREGTVYELDVEQTPQGYLLRGADGEAHLLQVKTRDDGSQHAVTPWGNFEVVSARRGSELWAKLGARRLTAQVERARPLAAGQANANAAGSLVAPMAGKLLRVDARLGDTVKAGQSLAVIEAMKMENELVAPLDGVVVEVAATPGPVEKGALIIRLEPT